MQDTTSTAIVPPAWQANELDGTPDNMVFGDNEDAYFREPTDAGIKYGHAEEWGEINKVYLPDSMTHGGRDELTPQEVSQRFDELQSFADPLVEAAYERGRRRGRDEIKGVLRDLVGPETAANVS